MKRGPTSTYQPPAIRPSFEHADWEQSARSRLGQTGLLLKLALSGPGLNVPSATNWHVQKGALLQGVQMYLYGPVRDTSFVSRKMLKYARNTRGFNARFIRRAVGYMVQMSSIQALYSLLARLLLVQRQKKP